MEFEHFRHRAAEARAMAETFTDPDLKEAAQNVATTYDSLAGSGAAGMTTIERACRNYLEAASATDASFAQRDAEPSMPAR